MLLLKDMHLMLQMSAQSFLNRKKGKNKKNELVKRGMLVLRIFFSTRSSTCTVDKHHSIKPPFQADSVIYTGKKAKELVYSGVHDWNHV